MTKNPPETSRRNAFLHAHPWFVPQASAAELGSGQPVLLLDDIGAERVTPWVTEQLVSLIDRRLQADVVTVVTTNLTSLDAIREHYTARDSDGIAGERLASRLGAAVFQWVRASGPDMRQYAVQTAGAR